MLGIAPAYVIGLTSAKVFSLKSFLLYNISNFFSLMMLKVFTKNKFFSSVAGAPPEPQVPKHVIGQPVMPKFDPSQALAKLKKAPVCMYVCVGYSQYDMIHGICDVVYEQGVLLVQHMGFIVEPMLKFCCFFSL